MKIISEVTFLKKDIGQRKRDRMVAKGVNRILETQEIYRQKEIANRKEK